MRKIFSTLAIAVLLGFVAYTALKGRTVDSFEYVCSLIQEEYGIELTENNVVNMTYEPKYSRDFACVASIELSDKYVHILEEHIQDDASWKLACEAEEIIDKYIKPSLSSFESLPTLIECCTKNDSYIQLVVYEEESPYVKEFSILVLNASDAELFYFTVK